MYITKEEIQFYLGIGIDPALDDFINTLIQGAQDYIEIYCGGGVVERRSFLAADPEVDQTKYYDGNGLSKLLIDDIRTITSIETYGVSITENTDYFLYPLNKTAKEWVELAQPETRINSNSRVGSFSPYIFELGQRRVKIVGKFGYSVTPPALIKAQCMRLVGAVIKENIGDSDVREITQETLGDYSVSFEAIESVANAIKVGEALNSYVRKPIPKKLVTMRQV